ncbi:hypothetical protein LCGC14_2637160 [marine sediment metagenome]|uniref:Uncharacterized protein n=1 Tax=marine sediment metagenome TaxID=412755 RepID=A0A0F8ZYG4_9ZZZZ
MLSTNDVGVLFACMKAAYGHQWPHTAEAIPVWQNALRRFKPKQVMEAANKAVFRHKDFPPTIGQFLDIVDPPALPARPNTYLPAPESTQAQRAAQLTMLKIVVKHGPITKFTLNLMQDLKNAIVREHGYKPVDPDFIDDLHNQLMGLVEKQAA